MHRLNRLDKPIEGTCLQLHLFTHVNNYHNLAVQPFKQFLKAWQFTADDTQFLEDATEECIYDIRHVSFLGLCSLGDVLQVNLTDSPHSIDLDGGHHPIHQLTLHYFVGLLQVGVGSYA